MTMKRQYATSVWFLMMFLSIKTSQSISPSSSQSRAAGSNRGTIEKQQQQEQRPKSGIATRRRRRRRQQLQEEEGDGDSSFPTNPKMEMNNEYLGIPGTTQTYSGYDTALGDEAICWKSAAAADLATIELQQSSTTSNSIQQDSSNGNNNDLDQLVKTVFPNPLVENFVLMGQTQILKRCPSGNLVRVEKPSESIRGERLRTLQYYNYTLHVEIDLETLDGDYIVTDDGYPTIALQVVVCSLGKSGFCSPFVHEQANTKDAIDKINSGEEITTTKKKVTGDLHGGTHIHSPWVFLNLTGTTTNKNDTTTTTTTLSANVTVPMIVNHPGEYFVIGTVQLYTGINDSVAYRWDIANAMDSGEGRYISYQHPPVILSVSDNVLYISYIAIGTASVIIFGLIGQTIYHRQHQVLLLSQGDFLVVFLISALISTVASFMFNPKSDIYCRIVNPIVLIPIQLMYAITVGRLWRIHAVISPLLLEHISKGRPGLTQRFVEAITWISFKLQNLFICDPQNRRHSNGGAKQQISQFQLALVVSIFTIPQVILQIVALFVQPERLMIQYNEDESIGTKTCGTDAPASQLLVIYGFFLLLLLVIILMVMAHSSRKLPSLFNETHVIYDSTFLSVVLLILGGAVIVLTDDPGTTPDVEYLVKIVLVLSITLNSAVRILVPKLQKVWKNEHVIVSKLVTDHHRKTREKQESRMMGASMRSSCVHVSGLDMSYSNKHHLDNSGKSRNGGDYDAGQTNRLLTIHSCSNDTGFNGRSSVSSGGDPAAISLAESQNDDPTAITIGGGGGQLEVINENPASSREMKQRRQAVHSATSSTDPTTSSVEFDMESPNHHKSHTNTLPIRDQGDNKVVPDGDVIADAKSVEDGGATADHDDGKSIDLPDLEAGETEARGDSQRQHASFFDQGASGFLRSAMAKGLSWRMTGKSDNTLGRASRHTDRQDRSRSPNRSRSPKTRKHLQKTIVVTEDETPARRLVLKMLDLQDQLEAVNNKIMSGLAVTQEDWGVITKLTAKLDRTFNEEVEFEWDIQQRYEEELQEVMPLDMSGHKKKDADETGTHKKHQPGDVTKSPSSRLKSARLKGINRKLSKDKERELFAGSNHSVQSFAYDDDSVVKAPSISNMTKLKSARLKGIQRKTSSDTQSHLLAGSNHGSVQSFAFDSNTDMSQLMDSLDQLPELQSFPPESPSLLSLPDDVPPASKESTSLPEGAPDTPSSSKEGTEAASLPETVSSDFADELLSRPNVTQGSTHTTVSYDSGRYFL